MNIKYSISKSDYLTPNKNLNILNRVVYIYLVVTFYKLINLLYSTDEVSVFKF